MMISSNNEKSADCEIQFCALKHATTSAAKVRHSQVLNITTMHTYDVSIYTYMLYVYSVYGEFLFYYIPTLMLMCCTCCHVNTMLCLYINLIYLYISQMVATQFMRELYISMNFDSRILLNEFARLKQILKWIKKPGRSARTILRIWKVNKLV